MKIFGIGMPKTGTTSLHLALQIVGYRSIHFAHDAKTVKEIEGGHYRLSLLEQYDAMSDIPVPAIFAQLDACWPDSKFILTVRDLNSWLDSSQHMWFNSPAGRPDPKDFRYFYRALLYGCIAFNKERFAWVYKTHLQRVREHFSGAKQHQLLILDIIGGEGWEKLCPFLGIPIPDCDFPHRNRRQTPSG